MAGVTVKGVDTLINKLNNLGAQGTRIASASVNAVADMIVVDAKQLAPKDLGTIAQNIGKEPLDQLGQIVKIFSAAPESPYQEFGTGGKVDVPNEMSEVASQFHGASGGNMQAFILALVEWVRRHGLTGTYSIKTRKRTGTKATNYDADLAAAWLIARSILRNGLKPQPFLFPAWVGNKDKLLPMLQTALNDLMRANQD